MDTPHIVPLSRQSVEVLRALKLLTGNGRLAFPGANDKNKPMSNNTILYALYRLGYRDRMTGHGFRGLASTILNENGFDEAHIELQLAHMKRTAYLINTARGPIVDEAALVEALKSGQIAGAGLDVFEREPHVLPALLSCENAILTPHIGSATASTRKAMGDLVLANLRAYFAGEPLLTPVPR